MGKRFAILIGAAALGAALMAVGASADFRSVHDPRGDTRCEYKRGQYCEDWKRRGADIVRATAGHDGTRLRHTIRVVGKVQKARLYINTDSDQSCEWVLYIAHERAGHSEFTNCDDPLARTGRRARIDFHHHSVEVVFSERSIGNPQSYRWKASAQAGGLPNASDAVPKHGYIRHRLAQPAAALVDSVPPNLQLSGPKRQDPQNDPLHHNCDNGYCDVVVKARCGHQTCTAHRSMWKLTNVRNDNLTPDGSWDVIQPGRFRPFGHELTLSQCRQVRRALKRGEKVKAKFTVRARDAAGNLATAKRTIRIVKRVRHQ